MHRSGGIDVDSHSKRERDRLWNRHRTPPPGAVTTESPFTSGNLTSSQSTNGIFTQVNFNIFSLMYV